MEPVKSRREEATDSTRTALVDSATTLFAERGYARTSLDDVVAAARVTKGALYHHFPRGKSALFEAVFVAVDRVLAEQTLAGIRPGASGWELVEQGLSAYLAACTTPLVRRVIFQEGHAVLGHERWRHLDGCEGRHLLEASLRVLVDEGEIVARDLDLLARLVFATLGEAGLAVAEADDPDTVRRDALRLLLAMVRGLGAEPPVARVTRLDVGRPPLVARGG